MKTWRQFQVGLEDGRDANRERSAAVAADRSIISKLTSSAFLRLQSLELKLIPSLQS